MTNPMTTGLPRKAGPIFASMMAGLAMLVAAVAPANAAGERGSAAGNATSAGGQTQTAIFAGGCFWCVEADFDKVPGVKETISGFTGGFKKNPTYREVVSTRTGHYEAVKVTFDPSVVTYRKLVDIFWRTIDPTDDGGQFCDRGQAYRTAIFPLNSAQRTAAERSKAAIESRKLVKAPLVTKIIDASEFYAAEQYHQNFYKKSPGRYYSYRAGCGRDNRVKSVWGAEAYKGIPGKTAKVGDQASAPSSGGSLFTGLFGFGASDGK